MSWTDYSDGPGWHTDKQHVVYSVSSQQLQQRATYNRNPASRLNRGPSTPSGGCADYSDGPGSESDDSESSYESDESNSAFDSEGEYDSH